jgi:hypothetical protein
MTEKENPQGSRYMTEKESIKAIQGPTIPAHNDLQAIPLHAVRVTVQATDAFKHYKIRCRQLVYTEKDPARAIPFKTL